MRNHTGLPLLVCALLVTSCGSHFDQADDPFFRALRAADRRETGQATALFAELAKQGDCDAQEEYAAFLFRGIGGRRDTSGGFEWLRKASDQGQPLAQLALGDVYYNKSPVTNLYCSANCTTWPPQDLPTAYKWYLLGEKGVWTAKDKTYAAGVLTSIRADMNAGQRAEGERLANEWKPAPKLCQPRHYF
jgi:TPR repeat protein